MFDRPYFVTAANDLSSSVSPLVNLVCAFKLPSPTNNSKTKIAIDFDMALCFVYQKYII
jgi:hypothetical protein